MRLFRHDLLVIEYMMHGIAFISAEWIAFVKIISHLQRCISIDDSSGEDSTEFVSSNKLLMR